MKGWQTIGLVIGLAAIAVGCSGVAVQNKDQGKGTELTPEIASQSLPSTTVISVGDGDTLRMDRQGTNATVRLAFIDAPETSQTPYGPAATERLRQLTPEALPFSSERPIPTALDAWWLRSMLVART